MYETLRIHEKNHISLFLLKKQTLYFINQCLRVFNTFKKEIWKSRLTFCLSSDLRFGREYFTHMEGVVIIETKATLNGTMKHIEGMRPYQFLFYVIETTFKR